MDKTKFEVYGMVRWRGEKLANGIDGVFETDNEKVIMRLRQMGFKEIVDTPVVAPIVPKKQVTKKKGKKK